MKKEALKELFTSDLEYLYDAEKELEPIREGYESLARTAGKSFPKGPETAFRICRRG